MLLLILLIVSALVVLGLTIATVLFYSKHKMPPTDYYTFFILGICWTPLGVLGFVLKNPGFYGLFVMGIVFMALGLAHRKDWKKNHRTWKQMSKSEQKFKMWIMIPIGILVLLGLAAFMAVRFVD
ncbi:hypothetical protein KY362_01215 [Candidatus Woesearchaeota archaeon]|nr:hypothetical protein [Candidatus Woesearchaeota archaeon]